MSNKILVVDDELSFREPISNFLKVSGYKTLTASSGEKALEIMKTFLPDLVLTDIKMPGMDGLTFSKNIKTKHPAIEVILMTALGNIEGAVKAMQDGAFDYVSKPFFFEDLLLHVTAVFEKIELKQKLYEYK